MSSALLQALPQHPQLPQYPQLPAHPPILSILPFLDIPSILPIFIYVSFPGHHMICMYVLLIIFSSTNTKGAQNFA